MFRLGILGGVVITAIMIWFAVFTLPVSNTLDVYILNVGQGDAIYVRSPSGRDMLIDTGPNDKVIKELEAVMPSFDRALDVLVLTHTDADHVGGAAELLARYDIGMIIEGGGTASSSVYERYRQNAIKQHVSRTIVSSGDNVHLDEDTHMDVLLPRRSDVQQKMKNANIGANDIAIVGKLQYRDASLLLTADIERRGEVVLATSNANLESSVLKVGHHGSKYSSWKLFLDRVRPQISAISVGVNNYGHPTEQALTRLTNEGSSILRTDTNGRIHLRSTGSQFVVVER